MRNSAASSGDDWTIIKLLGWTTSYFASRAIESPRSGAEILLAHVLNLQRVDLYLRYDQPLTRTLQGIDPTAGPT
jgi:release factor glutamine methyltransferase